MVPYFGDFAVNSTVYIPINTFDSNDPAASVTVTNLVNTDVHIHKDGGTTQRNNAAGITMTINYDSITGNHLLIIDTSDNTVADFWEAGHEYQVRIEGATVDGGTINAWVGSFSIERAGGALALIKSATYGLSALKTLLDTTGIKVASFADNAITAASINADAITNAKIADNAIAAENLAGDCITSAKIADNAFANEHFADGALTSTEITSAGGCVVASIANNAITANAINNDAITAAKIANGAIDAATFAADVDAEIATMVWNAATASYGGAGTYGQAVEDVRDDTNELQTDWHDGGRLDLLLDGASAPSAADVADAVWDEALSGHLGAGSTGNALNAAGSAGDPWATALPGAYGAGTAGLLLGTTIPAAIDAIDNYVDTEIGALTTELAKVPKSDSNVSWNATALAAIQGECTDALNAYDPPTNAEFELRTLPAADYTVVSDLGTVQTGDAFARLGAPAGESVSADIAAIKAETAAIVADTNELQVDDYPTSIAAVKTVVDAIQAKTDDLTFTAAGQVDANVQSVNDVALTGDGSATPWGPA